MRGFDDSEISIEREFTPICFQDDNRCFEQVGEFDGIDDLVRVCVGTDNFRQDLLASKSNYMMPTDTLSNFEREGFNEDMSRVAMLNEILANNLERGGVNYKGEPRLLMACDHNQAYIKNFLMVGDDDCSKRVMLSQSSIYSINLDHLNLPFTPFKNTLVYGFYPNADERDKLSRLFKRNRVTGQMIKLLDDGCAVFLCGFVESRDTSKPKHIGVDYFYKNYRKMATNTHIHQVFLVANDKTAKANLASYGFYTALPRTEFQVYKSCAYDDYSLFKERVLAGVKKELGDDDYRHLDEHQVYLAWELDNDIMSADRLKYLRDMFDFPIDDNLILAMSDLENSMKN